MTGLFAFFPLLQQNPAIPAQQYASRTYFFKKIRFPKEKP